jgi:hypothetical protein
MNRPTISVTSGLAGLVAPILFAVFPLLSLFTQNQTDIELSLLWWPLVWSVAAAIVVYGALLLATRRPDKAGALASLVLVAFFYFGWFSLPVWLWLALVVAGVALVVRTKRPLGKLTLILTVGAAALAIPRAVDIGIYQANHPLLSATDARLWPTALQPPPRNAASNLPDIYVLIPDDYARADVLRRHFHYDNAAFRSALKKRGFVISEQSRSPYSDSESNIAGALNMDYLSQFPKVLGKRSQDVRPVMVVEEDNRAARLLKTLGYRYVHLDTDEVTFSGGNPDISPFAPPGSFANLWMEKTILTRVGGPLGFNQQATDTRFRDSVNAGFSKLARVPSEAGPKFVVFHTLIPHDPYVFGAQGEAVKFPSSSEDDLGSKLGMRYYLPQLKSLDRRLLAATDAIVAHSKTPPVIVIQSDEGFEANPDYVGEATQQDVRVKGLIALYMPGIRTPGVPQPPNAVNTLRFVFNRYVRTRYPMLRSASYPEGDFPYRYEEMRVKP